MAPSGAWVQNQYTTPNQVVHTAAVAAGTFQDQHDSDTLGRPDSASVNDPEGNVYGDSSYDSSGRLLNVTNPFRSTSDSTYGTNTLQYDPLDFAILIWPTFAHLIWPTP